MAEFSKTELNFSPLYQEAMSASRISRAVGHSVVTLEILNRELDEKLANLNLKYEEVLGRQMTLGCYEAIELTDGNENIAHDTDGITPLEQSGLFKGFTSFQRPRHKVGFNLVEVCLWLRPTDSKFIGYADKSRGDVLVPLSQLEDAPIGIK